jgi:hypothetical protein
MSADPIVQSRQANRLRLLRAMYDLGGADVHAFVPMKEAFERAGLDWEAGTSAYDYLQREGLLLGRADHHTSITHEGVKEYEQALEGEGQATEHFPQPIVQYVVQTFRGSVNAPVQVGGRDDASESRTPSVAKLGDLAGVIKQLREEAHLLPEELRAVVTDAIDKVQQQAEATAPNTTVMTMYLKALTAFPHLVPMVNSALEALSNIGA